MRLPVRARAFAGALILLCATIAACSDSNAPDNITVQVKDNSFDPMTATVGTGATVTWNWAGANQHNVTWVNTSGTSNSPTQATGTFTRTFSNTGTYDYYCTLHGTATTGMRGSVVVQ
ncbi:MAG TPA: cupredoxin domain-containing protein [Gemmatimonadales bacterium]|nr:cupredoxin domain-containing protein [Gemmatimonadales bacterium]